MNAPGEEVGPGGTIQARMGGRCQGPASSLALPRGAPYHTIFAATRTQTRWGPIMSIDKSLRRKNQLARSRNVLTRGERIKVLQSDERWPEGRSPFGLPKVRVLKVSKKSKGKTKEEAAPTEAAAAAPAAAEAKPADKK